MRNAGVIDAPDAVRDGARYLEAGASDGHTLVVVHRTEDISKNLGGDTRKAQRQALGALEEDPTQLEALLKLTEKVIFDSDDVVHTTPLRPTTGPERTRRQAKRRHRSRFRQPGGSLRRDARGASRAATSSCCSTR